MRSPDRSRMRSPAGRSMPGWISPGILIGPVWTDPVTGEYSISLAAGVDYTFSVSAWVDGYQTSLRNVGMLTGDQTEDFGLSVDPIVCAAPGYSPDFVYFEDFEGSDGGYTTTGTTSFAWGVPTSGPRSAHSGENVWATNLSGNYSDNEHGGIISPADQSERVCRSDCDRDLVAVAANGRFL